MRNTLALLCLSALALGCSREAPKAPVAPARPAPTYESELARVDRVIGSHAARAARMPTSWTAKERLARAHLERARLTGDYEGYARARALLDDAAAISTGVGPALSYAGLEFSMHRHEAARAWMKKVMSKRVVTRPEKIAVTGLAAAIALEEGRYDEALHGFEAVRAVEASPQALARLALHHWRTGDLDAADALYAKAAARFHGFEKHQRAWFPLQRGLLDLDRGRYDDALAHYRDAARELAGYWLVDEHMAEIHALKGEHERARALYTRLVEETGSPEFMDALSEVEAALGDKAASARWSQQARAVYEERLARFPEATLGHALDHFLAADDDESRARAVQLAEQNRDLRPGGPAQVQLAQAYLNAGRVDDARGVVDATLKTRFVSAELYAVAAEVYARLDQGDRARGLRKKAARINPRLAPEA